MADLAGSHTHTWLCVRKSWCAFALGALAACHVSSDGPYRSREDSAHLRITESSWSPTAEFTNAAVLNDTSALTWSEDKPSLRFVGRHRSVQLPVLSAVVGAGPGDHPGVTALLDRVGQVLLFDDMSGVLSLGGRVVLEAQPHAGVRTRGVWFVVLDKPDGPVLLRSVFDRGEPSGE